jgi:myo-inositol-1(or 4)-monophosphatase
VPESISPLFLATAVQAVIKAGAMQLAGIDHLDVEKKGTIDLVTQVDREVERMFRALIGERFPDHAVLAEEFELSGDRQNEAEYCWVFDPVDGTTNYAHGLPIFCCACSLERNRRPIVAAIYDPSRRELFTAERGAGAWLNGAPMRVSTAATMIDSLLCTV